MPPLVQSLALVLELVNVISGLALHLKLAHDIGGKRVWEFYFDISGNDVVSSVKVVFYRGTVSVDGRDYDSFHCGLLFCCEERWGESPPTMC